MFKTILVAIDGSEVSKKALEAAIDEAKIRSSRLNAVYVIETGGFESIPTDSASELIYSRFESVGQTALKEGEELAEKHNLQLNTFIKQGHAGEEILSLADEIKADLIVMGTKGKSNIDRMLIGSVTEYVISHCKVSTMVVRV
ncbi:universal stress protein [Methanoplanus sp. FWC-SCC4]|uniref:Universal stress protein n=1 Tax=Methanochimaera problematica TaxID=2609417 RepID=A0AA97I2U2_9EURY|nr:universal stress protein [Methanoplanus sp. FWC-SCC4]WOF15958.1 universal stress protein [Methanoplanus sp. FWC-SCC4]